MLACSLPLGGSGVKPTQSGDVPNATDTALPTQTPFDAVMATAHVTPIPTITATATSSGVHLLAPPDGSELAGAGLLTFDWEPYTGASGYRIDFTNPKGATVSFTEFGTRHERYAESLPWGGDFTWQVLALDSRGRVLASSAVWVFYKPAASSGGDPGDGGDGGDDGGEERHP